MVLLMVCPVDLEAVVEAVVLHLVDQEVHLHRDKVM